MNPTFESTVAGTRTTALSATVSMDAPVARAPLGPALAAGTRLGEFEIVRLIGEGGFGIVYLALDQSLQREVAIKEFLPPSLATREPGTDRVVTLSAQHRETFDAGLRSFLNEARLLARFDHPSLVKVLRFWEGNGTAYMAMPHYRGPTLRHSLLAAGTRPSESDLLGWVHPLLDAIDILHQGQCFHRDIAPDNILLTDRGPVLLDFGAARHVISDMTQALTVVLKPSFAPIEQYGGSSSMGQGPWTDLYALACVLHFAIVGKAPVPSVERVLFDELVPLSQAAQGRYSAGLLAAIDAALALRPQDRPQDVAAFRRLLMQAGGQPGSNDLDLLLDEPLDSGGAPFLATQATAAATPTVAFVAPASTTSIIAAPIFEAAAVDAPILDAPVVATPPAAETEAATSAVPARLDTERPSAREAVIASPVHAPAATPTKGRSLAIRLTAAGAIVTATLIGLALHERIGPASPVPTVPAANEPAPSTQTLPAQAPPMIHPPAVASPASATLPVDRAGEAESAPSPDAPRAARVAVPERATEAPVRTRASARNPANQHDAASASASASAAAMTTAAKPHPASAAPTEAAPHVKSRCAEILEKASLGALAPDDATTLKNECR